MSTRSAMQLMAHHTVYAELRRDAVEAMRADEVVMYSVVPVGGKDEDCGYVACRLPSSVYAPFVHSILNPVEADIGPLGVASPGIVVQEREGSRTVFIPTLGVPPDDGGMEFQFFWFGGEGVPPERMVTLKGSKCPGPFVRAEFSEGARDKKKPVVCAMGISPRVDLFIEHVAAFFDFKHRCWTCGRPVSGRNKCSRCRAATYCDGGCQREDWRRHKAEDCLVVYKHDCAK